MKTKLMTIVLTTLFALSSLLPVSVWAAPAADLSTIATSVVRIEIFDASGDVVGVGSGSIIDTRGLVLTNFHVIEESVDTNYMVGIQIPTSTRSNEFTPFYGYVSAVDEELDLAVVQIVATLDWEPVETLTFPALPLGDSDTLELGDEVIAIGYPDISVLHLATTRGNIAGFMEEQGWILSDVVTSNGNSGGALTNLDEELVAIPSMVNTGATSGATMSYARPINLALPLINKAMSDFEQIIQTLFNQDDQQVNNHSPAANAAAVANTKETSLVLLGLDSIEYQKATRNGNRSSRTMRFINDIFVDAEWLLYDDNTFEFNYVLDGEPGTAQGEYYFSEANETIYLEASFFEAALAVQDDQLYFAVKVVIETTSGDTYKADFFQSAQVIGSGETAEPITLSIINQSNTTICYVYISASTAETWGNDWLGRDEMIEPNDKYNFSVQPGDYDLLLEDCDGNEIQHVYDVQLNEDSTWKIQE